MGVEGQREKFVAYTKKEDNSSIILEKIKNQEKVEIKQIELERLNTVFNTQIQTAEDLNNLEKRTKRKIFKDQLKEVNWWVLVGSLSTKKLAKRLRKERKTAEKQLKRNDMFAELLPLSAFNKTSEQFQADMMNILNNQWTISKSFVAEVYTNPNYKNYIDDIYADARNNNPALYAQLQAVQKDSYIFVDNKWNYVYQNPVREGTMNWKIKYKKKYENVGDAVKNWDTEWVVDALFDKTEHSPSQREFRKWAGQLGLVIWWVVLGVTWLKSAWAVITWKWKWNWWKFLWIPAALFLYQAVWGIGGIMKKWADLFSDSDDNSESGNEVSETYAKWYPAITMIFWGMTGKQIWNFVEKDDNWWIKMKSWWADSLSESNKNQTGDRAKAIKKILKMKPENRDRMMQLALMGVYGSYSEFESKKEEKIDSALKSNYVRINNLTKYMDDNDYKELNIDQHKTELTKYIRTGEPSLKELEEEGLFLKEKLPKWEDLNDRTTTKTKENLNKTNLPVAEKIAIQKTMNMLYEKVDDKAKANLKLNIDANGNIAWLSSYGQILKLNYKDEEIDGLDMSFNDIDELFKTANLINKLKDITKDNSTNLENQTNPFNSTNFNTWIWDFWTVSFDKIKDTSIFSKGFWNSLVWNDLTLLRWNGWIVVLKTDEGKKKLASYLNNRRNTEVSSNRNSANIN